MDIITVRELVEQGYMAQIAAKACRVYLVEKPPAPNDDQKWYDLLVKKYGHMEEIEKIEQLGDNYYMLNGGMGTSGDHKLLMFKYDSTPDDGAGR